ncbi:patatin-like phospholipase family protein [bacterium]|nr:patatin-like phospholipase family protein [bacterium]
MTRILSIDGGGIRGIIPGQILIHLEKIFQDKSGNPDARIADYFDLIAGTSTGGILTCFYLIPDPAKPSRPKYRADEAVDIYVKRGKDIFESSFWRKVKTLWGFVDKEYSVKGLEKALADYFGDVQLKDLLKPSLVTAYDIENRSAEFFAQHDAYEPKNNFLTRQVARATSAAPTYFAPALVTSMAGKKIPLVDGGVFANNPALCAYAEARKFKGNPTAKDMVILSIGTGKIEKSYKYEEARKWGKAEWLQPILDIIMSAGPEVADYQLRMMFDAIDCSKQYLRIEPELGEASPQMDDVSEKNLKALQVAGDAAFNKYRVPIEDLADVLINSQSK